MRNVDDEFDRSCPVRDATIKAIKENNLSTTGILAFLMAMLTEVISSLEPDDRDARRKLADNIALGIQMANAQDFFSDKPQPDIH